MLRQGNVWIFVYTRRISLFIFLAGIWAGILTVPDPGKGVCADPVNRAAMLGKEGPDPQGGNKGHQLSPDKGREKM